MYKSILKALRFISLPITMFYFVYPAAIMFYIFMDIDKLKDKPGIYTSFIVLAIYALVGLFAFVLSLIDLGRLANKFRRIAILMSSVFVCVAAPRDSYNWINGFNDYKPFFFYLALISACFGLILQYFEVSQENEMLKAKNQPEDKQKLAKENNIILVIMTVISAVFQSGTNIFENLPKDSQQKAVFALFIVSFVILVLIELYVKNNNLRTANLAAVLIMVLSVANIIIGAVNLDNLKTLMFWAVPSLLCNLYIFSYIMLQNNSFKAFVKKLR